MVQSLTIVWRSLIEYLGLALDRILSRQFVADLLIYMLNEPITEFAFIQVPQNCWFPKTEHMLNNATLK